MSKPDIRQNAGRCDWCGEMVEMDSGDKMVLTAEDEMGNEEHGVSAQEAADAIARALERIGAPKDKMLAELIRKNVGYRLHQRCFEESSLDQLYVEDGAAGNTTPRSDSSEGEE